MKLSLRHLLLQMPRSQKLLLLLLLLLLMMMILVRLPHLLIRDASAAFDDE